MNVKLYGTTHKFENKAEAKMFLVECIYNSEGVERERYLDVLLKLHDTKENTVSDESDVEVIRYG